MTDATQWAMLVFLAAGAVAMFAIAADILSRCPELQNRIEILTEELAEYHNRHRCGCGGPECNRCADDERIDELLAQSEQGG